MDEPAWEITLGEGPVIGAAIHAGHAIRPELVAQLAIDEATRLHEEDPFTDELAQVFSTRIIGRRSRFEFDLNRPRDKAVYLVAEDAWGLKVWRGPPAPDLLERSLAEYDAFYRQVERLLQERVDQFGRVFVFDLHSYNHRRDGAGSPVSDSHANPEINLGTASIDRERWGSVLAEVADVFRSFDYLGRGLDVRENVKFQGGHFPRWCHAKFAGSVGVVAVEFKKFFMDEWTGQVDRSQLAALRQMVELAAARVTEILGATHR
jgi:N-formylglutamate amidohydrolase